jgi:hypothetical protein
MSLISLLVALIVIGLMFWAVQKICGAFAIPAPVARRHRRPAGETHRALRASGRVRRAAAY